MTSSNQSVQTLPILLNHYRDLVSHRPEYEEYNQLMHTYHSVAIEGGTLYLDETKSFLEMGLPAAGKPWHHHLMLMDHQLAQQQMLSWPAEREPLNHARLQAIAAMIMRQTDGPTHTLLGSFDSSLGEFRTVSAMAGGRMFMDAQKVPAAVDKLLKQINTALPAAKTIRQMYDLSFQAHYDLVSIHPFGDGNGRSARLLMNYIQHYHGLPISLVHVEDRRAYINALAQSRHQAYPKPMLDFMYAQLTTFLQLECNQLR
ncbi:Fic family protein [Spirosoma litoris]